MADDVELSRWRVAQITVAALKETGVQARMGDRPGVFHYDPNGTDPRVVHRAVNLSQRTVGLDPISFEDWCAEQREKYPGVAGWLDVWGAP